MFLSVLSILVIPLIVMVVIKTFIYLSPRKPKDLKGRHVVVTGGSSGIGKSAAILAAEKGANVTIIARNPFRLGLAKAEIEAVCVNKEQIITTIIADVSNRALIFGELDTLERRVGPIYMLINCAGMAICGVTEKFTENEINTLLDVNYLGTLFPIQNIIPKFKERKEGIIVITASQSALIGIYGYSIYSSCKFALRGLAESIAMELKPYKISVTLALPPDTDTPGFHIENKTKPEETMLISQSAGLFHPRVVAEKLLKDALIGNFFSYVGTDSFFLTTLCVGMSPFSGFLEVLFQSLIIGPLRIVGAYYATSFDRIVQRCYVAKTNRY